MTVSHAAQPARIAEPAARTARIRTQANIAALYRRVLLRTELLLTIAAAPRPRVACDR